MNIERNRSNFYSLYHSLPDKENIFYVFIKSGLLMYLKCAFEPVPNHINLVILTSGLSEGEKEWVSGCGRPYYHFPDGEDLDDRDVWELLFEINDYSFGWLDADCYVINPEIFGRIGNIAKDTAIQGFWGYTCWNGFSFINTYLSYINIDAVKETGIKPGIYLYKKNPSLVRKQNIIPPELIRVLSDSVPIGLIPSGEEYFDTLYMFQMVSKIKGYDLKKIPADVNDAFHVGRSCIMTLMNTGTGISGLFEGSLININTLFISRWLLGKHIADLPHSYFYLLGRIKDELYKIEKSGIDPYRIFKTLAKQNGIDLSLAERIYGVNYVCKGRG